MIVLVFLLFLGLGTADLGCHPAVVPDAGIIDARTAEMAAEHTSVVLSCHF